MCFYILPTSPPSNTSNVFFQLRGLTNVDILQGPPARGRGTKLVPARFGAKLAFGVLGKAPATRVLSARMDVPWWSSSVSGVHLVQVLLTTSDTPAQGTPRS